MAAGEASYWLTTTTTSIHAVSEALFPKNSINAPDFEETELVSRTLEYLDELPPAQRRLLMTLFIFLELATPLLALYPARYSRLSVERRTALVQGWRRHWFQPFGWLGDALKATMTMMYMSHPSVIRHVEGFKTCERPTDPLNFPIDKDALKRLPVVPS